MSKTCKERVKEAFEERMQDIRTLFEAPDQETEELGSLYDYGLAIDYVEPGTFKGQREGYARYQLSYGGPSEEFRLYQNGELEFWFLDWFDGASVEVTGSDAGIIEDIITSALPDFKIYG